jgi:hypothetical protein
MQRAHKNYPINIEIYNLLHSSNLSPKEFVEHLGYRNIAKGLRHLDSWLQGIGKESFLDSLCLHYPAAAAELRYAYILTKDKLMQEWLEEQRRTFRPFCYAKASKMPKRVFTRMGALNKLRVKLPNAETRLEDVQALIEEHYKANKDGELNITHYVFAPTFTLLLKLDTEGEIVEVAQTSGNAKPQVWFEVY